MQLKGLAFGLDGQLRVNFGNHLRLGCEGYSSEYSYENSSYASIGRGGVLMDCVWEIGEFLPFVGGTIGVGSQTNATNFSKLKNDYMPEIASFRKYNFVCIVPFVGVEYALSEKIHLMFKTDYIFNVSNRENDFVTGPRFYFGFAFCR